MKLRIFGKSKPKNYHSTGTDNFIYLFAEAKVDVPDNVDSLEAAKIIGKATEHIPIDEIKHKVMWDDSTREGYNPNTTDVC